MKRNDLNEAKNVSGFFLQPFARFDFQLMTLFSFGSTPPFPQLKYHICFFCLFSSSVADRIQVQGKRIPVLQHLAKERDATGEWMTKLGLSDVFVQSSDKLFCPPAPHKKAHFAISLHTPPLKGVLLWRKTILQNYSQIFLYICGS